MIRKQGFKTELINSIKKVMIRNVLAEEPANPTSTQQINYEQLIATARKEEKDKLYPLLNAEKEKVKTLTTQHNELLLSNAQLQKDYEAVKVELQQLKDNKGIKDSEIVTKLKEEKVKLENELKQLRESAVNVDDLRAEIEKEVKAKYEVDLYKVEKMSSDDYKGKIIPELVSGTTKEEIDASLESSKNRYSELFAQASPTPQQTTPSVPAGTPNMNTFNQGTIGADDISSMSISDWAEYRKKLGLN